MKLYFLENIDVFGLFCEWMCSTLTIFISIQQEKNLLQGRRFVAKMIYYGLSANKGLGQ